MGNADAMVKDASKEVYTKEPSLEEYKNTNVELNLDITIDTFKKFYEIIVNKNDIGDSIYIIKSGEVQCLDKDEEKKDKINQNGYYLNYKLM